MSFSVLRKTASILIIFSLFLTSCSMGTEVQKKYGVDAEYFAGLKLLEQGKENEARSKFQKCAKRGTYYCARKSAEELTKIGSIQEKNQAVIDFYKVYQDSDALLLALKHLSSVKETHKLIEISHNCDYTTEYNEIIKIRLEAMKKQGSANFEKDVFTWFTSRPITEFHYKFWRDTLSTDYPDFDKLDGMFFANEIEERQSFFTPEQFIINYRIKIYRRDYTYCVKNANQLLNYYETETLLPNAQLTSDLGKAFLYGSSDFAQNGLKFKNLAKKYQNTPAEFYFWFYAGRYFDKAVAYYSQSKKAFENAMECADTSEQKDNALWYLLNTSLNFSVNSIIDSIGTYSKQWKNPEYFEDFFETLISSLIASGKWDSFYKIYTQTDGYASDETVAAYAYIYGRLLQMGVAKAPDGETPEEATRKAFIRACKSGSAVYYKILSAYQLNLDASKIQTLLCKHNKSLVQDTNSEKSLALTKLLEGYAQFGFPELIYPAYCDLYQNNLSTDSALFLSDFLKKCGNEYNDYYSQSLRIASKAFNYGDRDFTKEELKLIYPENYKEYVDTYCKKYDINNSVIYALIRSESFFDADIVSTAGAIGLTQIMEFTGADIAQRLRKKDYSLTDAETNIEFGIYYLNNLYRRCENSYLQSFSAYNAGLTKVRRWLQGSMIDLGPKKNLSEDLFLEIIPVTETREYGRKLISASVMYNWLYDNESPSKIAFSSMVEKMISK